MESQSNQQEDTHKREEGKRLKEGTAHTIAAGVHKIGGPLKFEKNPKFIEERKKQFDELYSVQQAKYEGKSYIYSDTYCIIAFSKEPIKITLPDGNVKEGTSFVTTPLDIAKMLSNSLPEKVVVSKVRYSRRVATLDNGLINPDEEAKQEGGESWILYDSFRPFEGDCELKLVTFDEMEGKMVFWHSSAHIMGESMERDFGVHLCHGPPTSEGFFYDAYCGTEVINDIANHHCRYSRRRTTSSWRKQQRR